MTKTFLPVAVGALLAGQSQIAIADAFKTEASATLVSQYVFRGFDLSTEDPAVQGDFIVNHDSGFSFGAWGSTYDVGSDDGVEVDLMASYSIEVNKDLSFGIGLTEYTYTGDTDASTEFYVSASFQQFSLTYYDDTDLNTTYISLDAEFEVIDDVAVQFHYGDYDFDAGGGSSDWSIGGSFAATKALSLFALYTDNDLNVQGAEDYFVVGASYAF